ncbi:porin family protein [Niabella aquatica]
MTAKTTTIISICVMLLFASAARAQQTVDLGLRAGFNASKFTGKNSRKDQLIKPGYHVGLNVDMDVINNLSVQTGLLYSSKGARYKKLIDVADGGMTDTEENRKKWTSGYVYIELPLYAVYSFGRASNKFYAGAGPYFAYSTSLYSKVEGIEKKKAQFNDAYHKRFDIGIGLLAGYKITEKLSAQVGLEKGLTGITKEKAISDIKNFVINFSLSYDLFTLKGSD